MVQRYVRTRNDIREVEVVRNNVRSCVVDKKLVVPFQTRHHFQVASNRCYGFGPSSCSLLYRRGDYPIVAEHLSSTAKICIPLF